MKPNHYKIQRVLDSRFSLGKSSVCFGKRGRQYSTIKGIRLHITHLFSLNGSYGVTKEMVKEYLCSCRVIGFTHNGSYRNGQYRGWTYASEDIGSLYDIYESRMKGKVYDS